MYCTKNHPITKILNIKFKLLYIVLKFNLNFGLCFLNKNIHKNMCIGTAKINLVLCRMYVDKDRFSNNFMIKRLFFMLFLRIL